MPHALTTNAARDLREKGFPVFSNYQQNINYMPTVIISLCKDLVGCNFNAACHSKTAPFSKESYENKIFLKIQKTPQTKCLPQMALKNRKYRLTIQNLNGKELQ